MWGWQRSALQEVLAPELRSYVHVGSWKLNRYKLSSILWPFFLVAHKFKWPTTAGPQTSNPNQVGGTLCISIASTAFFGGYLRDRKKFIVWKLWALSVCLPDASLLLGHSTSEEKQEHLLNISHKTFYLVSLEISNVQLATYGYVLRLGGLRAKRMKNMILLEAFDAVPGKLFINATCLGNMLSFPIPARNIRFVHVWNSHD